MLLVIGHSGEASSTLEAVRKVARLAHHNPQPTEAIFDEIGNLALRGAAALQTGAFDALSELMNRNQQLLEALGVSTPRLQQMCEAARRAGAWGAKLTGGGGGGCMIAPARDRNTAERSAAALRELGRAATVVEIGGNYA